MLTTISIVILIFGSARRTPNLGATAEIGATGPGGGVGLILIIVIVLVLAGRI